MRWGFERVFYGTKKGLNLKSIRQYLALGYYPLPCTLWEGMYRAVYRTGDHDAIYDQIEKPFPDALEAQRPTGKFALHFSGGFDSAIVAKLYDREDVDYIHFTGPESVKARALAATLKGTLHEIQVTPELFIKEADELAPRLTEPYAFEDIVYAYIASKKARELGHTLVLTGDGGDWVFGGYLVGPDSKEAADIWKTLEPNRILGLETSMPLGHQALDLWSQAELPEKERTLEKAFARSYCRELGMPEEIVNQQKTPWSGRLGIDKDEAVLRHTQAAVDESDYRWIKDFQFVQPPKIHLWFRQYLLVKWLQINYKERLEAGEIRKFSEKAAESNIRERRIAASLRRKELVYRYCPHPAVRMARCIRNSMLRP